MGKCKFRANWLEEKDETGRKIGTWGRAGDNEGNMFCFICNRFLAVAKGLQSINQHAKTALHIQNVQTKLNVRQLTFTENYTSNETLGNLTSRMVCKADNAIRAEIIWCLKNIQSNMSAASTQGITEVFKAMFGSLPEGFSLSYTKLSYYITEALGPFCRQKYVISDVGENFYSIQYDETTNNKGLKELQVAIRYWSKEQNLVVVKHLETFFLGSATAEILKQHIQESLDHANLPIKNLLMLGSDGPNVNKKVFTLFNEELKALNRKSLINIGTCSIHLIHNSFLKGLLAFESHVSDFIVSLYYFFDGWPLRIQDFEKIQNDAMLPNHRFLKHVSSRWLTVGPAISRILEQYQAITEYFLKFVPIHRKSLISTKHYKDITKCLNKKSFKAELIFVKNASELFSKYTAFFQKTEPLIHILYEELKYLAVNLISKILKSTATIDFKNTAKSAEELFKLDNLLPIKDIHCGESVKTEITKLTEVDKLYFLKQCQKFFMESSKHILKKSPLILKDLKYFCWLNPSKIADVPDYYLTRVCDILPTTVDKDLIKDEFNMFKLLKQNYSNNGERIDIFWASVDSGKYPTLTKVAKICLSLVHGSADVERGFSLSGRVMPEDRSSMSLKMLNNKLYVHNALELYGKRPENFPITKELISMARSACASYKTFLKQQEIDKKLKEDELRRAEEEKEREQQASMELKQTQKRIEELEKELLTLSKAKLETQVTVDKLLNETNKKIERAIKSKDIVEVKVAHAMLSSALNQRADENKLQKEADRMTKTMCKRQTSVIDAIKNKKLKK